MGKFSEFKLALASMAPGKHHMEFHLDKQFFVNMENSDIHDADLAVSLDVDHSHGVYDMHFAVVGNVTLICDRCLDTLIYPLEATYHVIVKYGDDYNDESDDLLVIPHGDTSLNVAYMIYDTVVLAIPMKHVHPLGKCNRAMSAVLRKHRATGGDPEENALEEELLEGIDDEPSGDDSAPTDPRWDGLKKLTENN